MECFELNQLKYIVIEKKNYAYNLEYLNHKLRT